MMNTGMLDAKIYTLLKVVETGSYTAAAKALNLSQPAVSQHIHALEEELNVKLFERVGTHLILTREGEKVVAASRAMISLYRNLLDNLKDDASGIRRMNVGITHTVEANKISEVFARYVSEHNGVSMKLMTNTAQVLREQLKNYEIDFAIMDGSLPDPGLASIQLDTDSLVLVVWPDHPLTRKDVVRVEDVEKEKLILRLPNSGTRDLFMASLEARGISIDAFHVVLEVDNIATIKNLVTRGYGVSVLAKSACQSELRRKSIVALPIENLSMNRQINIIYPKDFKYQNMLKEIAVLYNEI